MIDFDDFSAVASKPTAAGAFDPFGPTSEPARQQYQQPAFQQQPQQNNGNSVSFHLVGLLDDFSTLNFGPTSSMQQPQQKMGMQQSQQQMGMQQSKLQYMGGQQTQLPQQIGMQQQMSPQFNQHNYAQPNMQQKPVQNFDDLFSALPSKTSTNVDLLGMSSGRILFNRRAITKPGC